jgi:hypothetical protein
LRSIPIRASYTTGKLRTQSRPQNGVRSIVNKALRQAVRDLLERRISGRGITTFKDDLFIVSYPKSGNTWIRFLIGNILYRDEPVDFSNVETKVPDIYAHSNAILMNAPRPRALKSHEYFDPRYKKVIYVVRDPRDVVLSYFHFAIKRGEVPEDYPISQFVWRFINGKLDRFGSWYENVASWLYTRGGEDSFLMIRYEDILDDARRELRKIAEFTGAETDNDCLDRAIRLSSKDNMRRLEKKQSHLWVSTRQTKSDKPFVREGKSGGWRSDLPESCARQIEDQWGGLLRELGYM